MAGGKEDDSERRRADSNRARKLEAIRALETLLAVAMAPDFRGHIAVRVNSKDGTIAGPITTVEGHPR